MKNHYVLLLLLFKMYLFIINHYGVHDIPVTAMILQWPYHTLPLITSVSVISSLT